MRNDRRPSPEGPPSPPSSRPRKEAKVVQDHSGQGTTKTAELSKAEGDGDSSKAQSVQQPLAAPAPTMPRACESMRCRPAGEGPVIDMRSDTVTTPTEAMKEAMVSAVVGDDGLGEDPTVNALEALAAQMAGKEGAVLVPSGTMGNLLCVAVHCRSRGAEAIVGHLSHIYQYEQGGIATLAGVMPRVVPNKPDGSLDLKTLRGCIWDGTDVHHAITQLICLESTHNICGGRVVPMSHIKELKKLADEHGIHLHLDGARAFNAAAFLGVSLAELFAPFASATMCLSKGLGCPIGSIVVGNKRFVHEVRRLRKTFGGSMRQSGIIAGPGLVGLRVMTTRIKEDHTTALQFARGLAAFDERLGIEVDVPTVETNMVFFSSKHVSHNVLIKHFNISGYGGHPARVRLICMTKNGGMRVVTHYQVTSEDVEVALAKIKAVVVECISNPPSPSSSAPCKTTY
eukprot:GHVT01028051.1.p1 GENE.GHVT01028051.1~~GHVT01028051.1.p1  ORF type:complete len:456 (+),score=81.43 GHVT01028051.1:191-1558(+)